MEENEMIDFIKFIKLLADTPVPTIFVVAGLLFLFLAIGGRFGAKIVTDRVKQKYAGILGTILLFAGLALYLIPLILPKPPETVVVPNVVGLPLEKAETTLSKSDLKAGSVEPAQAKTVTAGTVLKQEPRAGVQVSKGEAVDLVVAAQPTPQPDIDIKARENWMWGNYDVALDSFALIVQKSDKPKAKKLAERRLKWLRPYGDHIIFADDFETDTIKTGARWILHEPGPGTGTGKFARIQEDGNFILEGHGHYHAVAKIKNGIIAQNFQIQLRFRPLSPQKDGAHINIMMDEIEGRSTIGLYIEGNILSLWEEKDGQETRVEHPQPFESRWYMLRIVAEGQHVQVFLDGKLVLDYTSPHSRVFLKGFNLESLSGKVRFDDVLVVYR